LRRGLFALVVLVACCFSAASLAAVPAGTPVSARLTAGPVTPKSTFKGAGTVVVRLDPKGGKACWTISVTGAGADKLLSAHVHKGAPGKLGPVVLPLGDRYAKQGCVYAKSAVIAAVAKSPRLYYVDVHTRKYLNGALRGQLHAGT
jgi:hypothetical protein